jgi:very-short-patch-repair endonuclease
MAHDEARTDYLSGKYIRVMRFHNRQVLLETEEVVLAIWEAPETPSPQPSPRERGSKPSGAFGPE